MTSLWLLRLTNMTRMPCIIYTHASHTHEPYYSHQTLQNKVMHRIAFYWFEWSCTKYTALHTWRSRSDHAEFSDLTDLIDRRESASGLHLTVKPDGGYRLVGVGCVMTSSIPINRKHSHIDPHVQLISSTVRTADLINNNRSHLSPPHI